MKFQCPACHANSFRLVVIGGKTEAECLECRRVTPFSVASMLDASGRTRIAETIPDRYHPRRRMNGVKRPSSEFAGR